MHYKKRRGPSISTWKIRATSLLIFTIALIGSSSIYLSHIGVNPWQFYANIANPYMRFVNVPAGLRKEEIADIFAKTLSWTDADKQAFFDTAAAYNKDNPEGMLLPTHYWVRSSAHGQEVAEQMIDTFNTQVNKEIFNKNKTNFKEKINIDTAVRIASIIQREASGNGDMRTISGVIWNRIFKGMSLDMDATLQYSKGTPGHWWPQVSAADKKIDSPYNTYKYKGLPPSAISNPSLEAIAAAYNPAQTDCIFYIHDQDHQFHCAVTYAEHKENIQRYLLGARSVNDSNNN